MKYPKAVLLAVLVFAVLSPSARADSGDSTIYTFTGGDAQTLEIRAACYQMANGVRTSTRARVTLPGNLHLRARWIFL